MKIIKLIAIVLCLSMVLCSFSACLGGGDTSESGDKKDTSKAEVKETDKAEQTDLEYILEKGTLVVGVTRYKPMSYIDESGEWTGFDTEFARLVADTLGVEVEFVEIDWDAKWDLLEKKQIDCVWNGLTLSTEAEDKALCTKPYVKNAQVVVTWKERTVELSSVERLGRLPVAVEQMSAGLSAARSAGLNVIHYPYQEDALTGFFNGGADACIIDLTMARAVVGRGEYEDLGIAFSLTSEEYTIACRKGSDLCARINGIMDGLIADGTLPRLAQKYELTLTSEL
ncbi:MAG: transporter substrate-binding domain-containing protein [Clostridia bacterium]|nr:transporter substrate-binding domain-containing protein [Clostridia bacterium]